jgi:hypothetical protein
MILFFIIVLSFFLCWRPRLDNFVVLKKKELELDLPKIFSVLTKNIISKSHDILPDLVGFPTKKNITETNKPGVSSVSVIIDDLLIKLNRTTQNSEVSWKLLELIKFDRKSNSEGTLYFIELFLVYLDTPIHLVIKVVVASGDRTELSTRTEFPEGGIHYNEVILFNKIKPFDNAFDPKEKQHFRLENTLGLLPPFKSSENLILNL